MTKPEVLSSQRGRFGLGLFLCLEILAIPCTVSAINQTCSRILPRSVRDEISSYRPIAERIIWQCLYGGYKGLAYDELTLFTDTFGSRLSGTENLEDSIDYLQHKLRTKYYLENVHGEPVRVPQWRRGYEEAYLVYPRRQKLNMLGLGFSAGTPMEGIRAKVLVLETFAEIILKADEVSGKIVVIREKWESYASAVAYRQQAASKVSRFGGVAVLISSETDFSLNNPHTGSMVYSQQEGVAKIPVAALAVEDSEMLLRMQKRGAPIMIYLYMESKTLPDTYSRNTVAEIVGRQGPQKVVMVSGHLDSWDVGQGALDDGAGSFVSWATLALVRYMGLRPRRTLRAVLWTGDEQNYLGAKSYKEKHKEDIDSYNIMMEPEMGAAPTGLKYKGPLEGECIIREIVKLLASLNVTQVIAQGKVGTDINVWQGEVPLLSNLRSNDRFYWFQHSNSDTMAVIESTDLDKATALFAVVAFVLADISVELPKPVNYHRYLGYNMYTRPYGGA